MITQSLFLLLAIVAGWLYFYLKTRVVSSLPGPFGLPFLGHLPMLGFYPYKTLSHWKNTYGPIFGVRFGHYRTVVLSDSKLIKQALNLNCFSGRPRLNFFKSRSDDGIVRGIGLTDGSHWAEQRRFAVKNLKDFGFGTKTMETKIQEEIQELLEFLKAQEGKPIQVKNLFNNAVLNALWSIIFGDKMRENDPESLTIFPGITTFIDDANMIGSLAIFLPWLAKIAPRLSGYEKMIQGFPIVKMFLRKQIKSHNVNYVKNQPRDFVDAYTDKMKETKDPMSSFHPNHDVMLYTVSDVIIAGSETTSSTLSWLCAYLIHHQLVQNKLQDEIDRVVGQEQVCLANRSSMPYTEAVINEVLRFSTIFPFAIFHRATEDVEFHGFAIPKNTIIIPNLYAIHFDEKIWGDPQNFRPERFIDSNGKFKKNENLLSFSTGKRICLGESLARDELFLFTVNLFQTFGVSQAVKLPSLDPHVGMALTPKPFEMILKKRNE